MSDKEINTAASNERGLVVKNKKYNKTDVIAFVVCLLAALVVWIHATNTELKQEQSNDETPTAPVESTQQVTE